MIARIRLAWLNIKGMRFRYFVPLILYYGLYPLALYCRQLTLANLPGMERELPLFACQLAQQLFPLGLFFHLHSFFKEQYDSGAQQLFEIYGQRRSDWLWDCLLFWAHSTALLLPALLIHRRYLGEFALLATRWALLFFFYTLFFLLLSKLLRTTLPALFLCLVYHIVFAFVYTGPSAYSLYTLDPPLSWSFLFPRYAYFFGLLLLVAALVYLLQSYSFFQNFSQRLRQFAKDAFHGKHRRRWIAGTTALFLAAGFGCYLFLKPVQMVYSYRQAEDHFLAYLQRNGLPFQPGEDDYFYYAEAVNFGLANYMDDQVEPDYESIALLEYAHVYYAIPLYNRLRWEEMPPLSLDAVADTPVNDLSMLLGEGAPSQFTMGTLHLAFRRQLCEEIAPTGLIQNEYYRRQVQGLSFAQLEEAVQTSLEEAGLDGITDPGHFAEQCTLNRDWLYQNLDLTATQKLQIFAYCRIYYTLLRQSEIEGTPFDLSPLAARPVEEIDREIDPVAQMVNSHPNQKERTARYSGESSHLGIWTSDIMNR
ncbi:hypothetical protein [Bittarella massiliensis (ex Durand et al. 2017)]|uniref:hypothetical protein n=1 Tax=Bittarella massiliensis (ex Durand et al. 2017) TaxID=1720313 RepID=UPI001AA17215|nr:hypothetical protein [Bittarella massiliensis (ex Durand et al. 2017)]MBO1679800.1 hypothetical protein [Bittarella massiliensis (ex Durand et al. 2017)]